MRHLKREIFKGLVSGTKRQKLNAFAIAIVHDAAKVSAAHLPVWWKWSAWMAAGITIRRIERS